MDEIWVFRSMGESLICKNMVFFLVILLRTTDPCYRVRILRRITELWYGVQSMLSFTDPCIRGRILRGITEPCYRMQSLPSPADPLPRVQFLRGITNPALQTLCPESNFCAELPVRILGSATKLHRPHQCPTTSARGRQRINVFSQGPAQLRVRLPTTQ